MKKCIPALLLSLLLAFLCPPLSACGWTQAGGNTRDAVSIWYVEGEPTAVELELLANEYNTSLKKGALPVSLRSFPDEAALAAAFDAVRPDLLLCSHERAFALYEAGMLRESDTEPLYADTLAAYSPCIGSGYFPIGFETQLLYMRSDAIESGVPADLEALLAIASEYGRENGLPFLTADSFSALLYDMLLSMGTELHGVRALDISSQNYVYAYNLLAEAAYTGGFAASEHPAVELVRQGYVSGAAVLSSHMLSAETEGYRIAPMPKLRACSVYLADAFGLAVTAREGKHLQEARSFIKWLSAPERLSRAALDSGLVPAAGFEATQAENELQAVLLDVAKVLEPHLPLPDADFSKNQDTLESSLRSAIDLLN